MAWHDVTALAILAAAAVLVMDRAYRALTSRHDSHCGSGCGTCASNNKLPASQPLVQIGPAPSTIHAVNR